MAVSPGEILAEVNPDAVPNEAPPEAANYTEADMQGISCAFCSKFSFTGLTSASDGSGEIPVGVCNQWEANVDGVHVCDRFASGLPTFDENGNESWEFSDKDKRQMAEVYFSGAAVAEIDAPEGENDSATGSIWVEKEILRTGEWPVIPTKSGLVDRALKIVRDGKSNAADGTIAMEELVENFKAGAIPNPQIPLSDDDEDHKNLTRLNTGFIRDIWIKDEGDGSKLVAKMEFTEREVGEKVLNGTYADVSCGIPWEVRSRGQDYGSCLEHCCITNRPFIDGLGPFLAASNAQIGTVEVVHFGDFTAKPELAPLTLSAEETKTKIGELLGSQLGLMPHYKVSDINFNDRQANVISTLADDVSWTVPFTVAEGDQITLAVLDQWEKHEIEPEGNPNAPVQQKRTAPRRSSDDELEAAYRLREIRLSDVSQPVSTNEGSDMSLTQEELDRLELSDEQRAAFQRVLDENATLTRSTREKDADKRIEELKDLGLADRPGFLKLYRDVHLADDGRPAAVLLSDSGQKERATAKELLDRAIEALKGPESGKIELSAQHTASGNDDPPPATPEETGDQKPLEERMKEAKTAIYGVA